jgi:hypothetical protein
LTALAGFPHSYHACNDNNKKGFPMTALERARRAMFLAACCSLLASCGGGGGDDDDEPEPPEEEEAAGLWRGTYGGTPNRMQAMVAPDGSFVAIILPSSPSANDARLLSGTGTVTAPDIINGTGTAYALLPNATLPNGSTSAPLTIAAGRVTEGVSLTGNFSAGGEVTTFSLSFLPQSTRTPSFATLAGVYNLFPAPTNGTQATMTVRTDGTATFNHSNGCIGNGTFTILDPALNMYRWSLSIANCTTPAVADHTAAGLAALHDSPAGGTANLLVMNGTATGAPLPWWIFNGTK